MTQQVIIPPEEDLKIESNGRVCTVEGCRALFQTSSQLQMHLTKHHQGKQLSVKIGNSLYYCPAENCERSLSRGKPFPRLGQLKQHYQRIHGEKVYSCLKCGKQFSLKDVHQRHEVECGKSFGCDSCGEVFKTRNALYKHTQRKGHTLPEGSKPKGKKSSTSNLPSSTVPIPPQPIIIKQVVRLPRPNLMSSSTQTEQEDLVLANQPKSDTSNGPHTKTGLSGSSSFEESVLSYVPNSLHSTMLLDLSTQTEPCSDHLEHMFDLSDLATQTDFTGLFDFGTQTTSQHTTSQSCQTTSTSTDNTATQNCQTYLPTQTCAPGMALEQPGPGPPGRHSVTAVQGYSHRMDEFVEFGTQTCPTDNHSLLGIATQISSGEFGTQTCPPDDLLAEFGTQTCLADNHSLLGIATQTSGDLLVEFGTQTDKQSLVATQTSPGDLLVEFGTQTCQLDNHSLMGIATQTDDFFDHLTNLESTIDFGTQTIEELFLEAGSSWL